MKLKTTVLGLGIGALLLTGCGGGGSDLPDPTAKIAKEDAKEIQGYVLMTGLDPVTMLQDIGGGTVSVVQKLSSLDKESTMVATDETNELWEGEHHCGISGTYTNKTISGLNPYDHDSSETNASKLVFEVIYEDCVWSDDIKMNGTKKKTWDWERDYEKRTWKNTWSGSSDNLVYEIDATHKFVTSSDTWSGTTLQNKDENEWYTISDSYTSHYVRSGTLIDGDTTLTFKNITRDKSSKNDYIHETGERTWKISGAIQSDDLGGWIVVNTPVTLEKNQDDRVVAGDTEDYCNHVGKITVTGADHVVTTEAHADHSIDVKYDDEVIAEYANCIEYHNDN